MLRAVQAARQRRHQGDGRDDADDRPGAEAEAPLPRRVDRPGGGVPDQQEARQHQHAGVEGEEHVADGRRPVRAEPAQEAEHVAGRAVGVGEEAPVDGLRRCGLGRRHHGKAEPGEGEDHQQDREAGTGPAAPLPGTRSHGVAGPRAATAHTPGAAPAARLFQAPEQVRSRPQCLGEGAAELGGEQEAERTHGLSWRPPRGCRGRAGGASLPRRARARRRRWRRAARRCGSAASRASARPPA